MRFVLAVIEGRLIVSNRKKADLMQELKDTGKKKDKINFKIIEISNI